MQLKINANKQYFEVHLVKQTPAVYLSEQGVAIAADWTVPGKAPLNYDDDRCSK